MAVSPPLDFSQKISIWGVTFVPWYSWDFLAENILVQFWQFCFCFWHIWGCSCFSFDISLLQFSPLTVQFCPDWTFLQIKFRNQIELCSWCCCFTFAVFFFFTIKFYPIFSGVFIYIVIFCGCISLMIFWYICISQLQFSPLTVQFCLPQPLVKDGTGEIMIVDLWTSYISLCLWFLIYICLFVAFVAPVGYQGWCPIIPKSVGFVSNKILSRFTRADSTRQSPYLVKSNLMMMMMYLIWFAFSWAFSFFNNDHPKYICLRWMRRSGST